MISPWSGRGVLATCAGDILLRTAGQVYRGDEFADLVLRSNSDGTRITLGDVASINDGFVETDGFSHFNRKPSATLRILTGGQQNELATSKVVKAFVEQQRAALPPGITLDIWVERALYLQGRLDMMMKNVLQGAALFFLVMSIVFETSVQALKSRRLCSRSGRPERVSKCNGRVQFA